MAGATIEQIRERNDLVEVIGSYVNLTKAGMRFKALCPFHQEKTPSFMVNPEKQLWHCFGCHEGGDVFTFIMKIEKLSFAEAAELLAARAGLRFMRGSETAREESRRQMILRVNLLAERFFQSMLHEPSGSHALAKWRERGIDDATLRAYRLGYAPDTWDSLWTYLQRQKISAEIAEAAGLIRRRHEGSGWYDYFRNRLIVPIRDVQGRVIAFGGRALGDDPAKYINSPENEVFSKRNVLFGLDMAHRSIAEADAAIVVEGYMDQIALFQHGFTNVVATMGTSITPEHLNRLRRYTRNLIIAFDPDSAGMNAVLRSVGLFEAQEVSVRVVEMPEGLDPDDFVRRRGPEAMRSLLETATSLVDYRIRQAIRQLAEGKSARYLDEDEYAAQMIRAVVPIIAEIASPVRREALIVKLAQEWCAPDLQRVGRAAEAIRREVSHHRRTRMNTRQPASPTPSTPGGAKVTDKRTVPSPGGKPEIPLSMRGVVRAERDLLAAMLQSRLSPDLLEVLPPERFVDPLDRMIAEKIREKVALQDETPPLEWFAHETEGDDREEMGKRLSELLVQETEFLAIRGAVEDRLNKVLNFWKKKEMRAKLEELAKRIDAGENVGAEELGQFHPPCS